MRDNGMTAVSNPTAPTAAQVDALAKEYKALEDAYFEATLASKAALEPLEKKKDELRELVAKFGSAHAEKSKLLHGIAFEIMATFGTSTSIDAAAVELFRLALVKAKQARLLKKLFEKTVRWTLNPTAAVIVKSEKLSKSLLALYSQCEVVKAKTPSVQVREKSA